MIVVEYMYFDIHVNVFISYNKRFNLHELVVSDDLDCHLLAGPGSVPGSDHIAEYTLASVAINIIALVQCLPNVYSLIVTYIKKRLLLKPQPLYGLI